MKLPETIMISPNTPKRIDSVRRENGKKLAEETFRFIMNHRYMFDLIYSYLSSLKQLEKQGRLRDRTIAYLLDHTGNGSFQIQNGVWAGIVRYMVLFDSSLLDHPIILHSSDIDHFGLYQLPEWGELCPDCGTTLVSPDEGEYRCETCGKWW